MATQEKRDFFISYNSADKAYADAIDTALKAAGYTTHYAGTDCAHGTNIPIWMNLALAQSVQVIGLCSPSYFSDAAVFSLMEMMAAIWQDPTGAMNRYVLVELMKTDYLPLIAPLARITATSGQTPELAAATLIDELKASDRRSAREELATVSPRPDVFRIDRPPLKSFTGHGQQLEELHQHLSSGQRSVVTQAISGLGGIGKTTLAAEYGHRYGTRGHYGGVWWINAESGAQQGLAELSTKVEELRGLDNHPVPEQARAVLDYVATQSPPWLLIYDNVETTDSVKPWLPSENVRVIITSRFDDWAGVAEKTRLPVWDSETTVDYLLDYAEREEREGAEKLAEILDGLPLAVDQAAAFLRENKTLSFTEYAQEISEAIDIARNAGNAGDYAAEERFASPQDATVYATLVKSIETLPETTQDLLCFISWLSPDGVDIALLVAAAGWDLDDIIPEPLRGALKGVLSRGPLIDAAARLSLLRISGEGMELSLIVHRITQAVLRRWQKGTDRGGWDVKATKLVHRLFPYNPDNDPSCWELCQTLLPHVLSLAEHGPRDGDGAKALDMLLNEASAYLAFVRSDTDAAIALMESNIELTIKTYGKNSRSYAVRLGNLSSLYINARRYEEAEIGLKEALKIGEAKLGPHDPARATQLKSLAQVYFLQGQFSDAEPLLKRALETQKHNNGEISHYVASILNALAVLYDNWAEKPGENHKGEQAQELHQQAVNIMREVQGERHPDVSGCLHNLAILCERLEDFEQAVKLQGRAAAIMLSLGLIETPETQLFLHYFQILLGMAGQQPESNMIVPMLFPEILTVENLMQEWVEQDPENRKFGPISFFADKPNEVLDFAKSSLED